MDKLKQYISEHRHELDLDRPDAGVWDKIQHGTHSWPIVKMMVIATAVVVTSIVTWRVLTPEKKIMPAPVIVQPKDTLPQDTTRILQPATPRKKKIIKPILPKAEPRQKKQARPAPPAPVPRKKKTLPHGKNNLDTTVVTYRYR